LAGAGWTLAAGVVAGAPDVTGGAGVLAAALLLGNAGVGATRWATSPLPLVVLEHAATAVHSARPVTTARAPTAHSVPG
jgi:hypothetical protein